MSEEQENELLKLLREQNELLKQQVSTLKELQVFWSRIVSDEYFNEMMQNEGVKLPK